VVEHLTTTGWLNTHETDSLHAGLERWKVAKLVRDDLFRADKAFSEVRLLDTQAEGCIDGLRVVCSTVATGNFIGRRVG
jgi:hypothetical protein